MALRACRSIMSEVRVAGNVVTAREFNCISEDPETVALSLRRILVDAYLQGHGHNQERRRELAQELGL